MPFDTYRAYQKSHPDQNWHFRRNWRERQFTPAELDRIADHELANGHVQRAEMLACQAAAMREARS
jgi:hypothetical protein